MLYLQINVVFAAEVAELAYALVSKTSGGNTLRVQFPPSAPNLLRKFDTDPAIGGRST